MSDLNAIFTAVSQLYVSIPQKEIKAVDLPEDLKPSYASADLPRRLLLPIGSKPMEGANGGIVTFGTQPGQAQQTLTWVLSDLLLYAPLGQGSNLAQFLPALISYCSAYANAALLRVRLVNNTHQKATLEGWQFECGLYQYPEDGEMAYYGVMTTLSIKELS